MREGAGEVLRLRRSRFDVIESERLLLVPWNADYDEQFAALCADPQAMRFITRGRPLPREIVDEILDRTREMWRQHGFGPFAAIEKRSGNWIGRIGLNLLPDWPWPDKWEVGSSCSPRHGVAALPPRVRVERSASRGTRHRSTESSASPLPTTSRHGGDGKKRDCVSRR